MPQLSAYFKAKWFTLHNEASNYPVFPNEEEKKAMLDTINNLSGIFLCKDPCAKEIKEFFINKPVEKYLETKEDVEELIYELHNNANKNLEKKLDKVPTLDEVRNAFRSTVFPFEDPKFKDYLMDKTIFDSKEQIEKETENNQLNAMELAILITVIIFSVIIIIMLSLVIYKLWYIKNK